MSNLNKINVDLVIEAQWVVPVVPRNHVLEHVAVAIHQGKIVEIGTHNELIARRGIYSTLAELQFAG